MEIPFEDVMDSGSVDQSSSSEIDFAEASGQSTSAALPSQPSKWKGRFDRLFTPVTDKSFESSPDDNFLSRVNKTLIRSARSFSDDPIEGVEGAAKALTSGAVSMGELGFKELLFGGVETFTKDMEQSQESIGKMREAASAVTAINLAPENKQDQAMEDLLMLIPEGITAAGDTVYERTGSAIAGAGTQAMLTLLTFKPSIASKTLSGLKRRPEVKASVEALAKTDPTAAEALAKHVEEASPRTAEVIRESVEKAKTV